MQDIIDLTGDDDLQSDRLGRNNAAEKNRKSNNTTNYSYNIGHENSDNSSILEVVSTNKCVDNNYVNSTIDIQADLQKCLDDYQFNLFDLCSLEPFLKEDETFNCDICDQSFRYKIALTSHLSTVHSVVVEADNEKISKKKSPKKNDKTTTWLLTTGLRKYFNVISTEENESYYACKRCNVTFRQLTEMKNHPYNCKKGVIFVCEICSMKYLTECGFRKHVSSRHGVDSCVICKRCSKMFANADLLASHVEEQHSEQEVER